MSHEPRTEACRTLLSQLSDYLDGELEEQLCAELESHLAGCEDCQVVLDTTRKTLVLYGKLEPIEVPGKSLERLWTALEQEGCVSPEDEGPSPEPPRPA